MTKTQCICFILCLIAPTTYQRAKFLLNRRSFDDTSFRDKVGLQIHHGHWGVLCVFVSSCALVLGWHNLLTVSLTGYGWGLILDEIIPHLLMPSPGRDIELRVYQIARLPTVILVATVALIMFVLYFASR